MIYLHLCHISTFSSRTWVLQLFDATYCGKVFQISTCLRCKGEGKVILENCKRCLGQGRVQVHGKVKVDVPAGISEGSTIQIEGEGNVDSKR